MKKFIAVSVFSGKDDNTKIKNIYDKLNNKSCFSLEEYKYNQFSGSKWNPFRKNNYFVIKGLIDESGEDFKYLQKLYEEDSDINLEEDYDTKEKIKKPITGTKGLEQVEYRYSKEEIENAEYYIIQIKGARSQLNELVVFEENGEISIDKLCTVYSKEENGDNIKRLGYIMYHPMPKNKDIIIQDGMANIVSAKFKNAVDGLQASGYTLKPVWITKEGYEKGIVNCYALDDIEELSFADKLEKEQGLDWFMLDGARNYLKVPSEYKDQFKDIQHHPFLGLVISRRLYDTLKNHNIKGIDWKNVGVVQFE